MPVVRHPCAGADAAAGGALRCGRQPGGQPAERTLKPLLLIGYGNPGRADDGLGPALVERLEAPPVSGLELMSDYQLTVDLAHDLAPYERVVFADATVAGPEPYALRRVAPAPPASFTSHSQRPDGVLYVARALFAARTRGYVLAIRGYVFDQFREELSPGACRNLDASVDFVRSRIAGCRDLDRLCSESDPQPGRVARAPG